MSILSFIFDLSRIFTATFSPVKTFASCAPLFGDLRRAVDAELRNRYRPDVGFGQALEGNPSRFGGAATPSGQFQRY